MSNKTLKLKANKLFSEYIRRSFADDYGDCTCYTCGKVLPWKELQCGHGIAGRGNYVLYLEEICRPQCFQCNVGKQGNYQVFIPKLIREHGQEQYEQWVIESKKPLQRKAGDYQDIISYYTMRLAELAP